jgi:hypothetical protein
MIMVVAIIFWRKLYIRDYTKERILWDDCRFLLLKHGEDGKLMFRRCLHFCTGSRSNSMIREKLLICLDRGIVYPYDKTSDHRNGGVI